MVLLGKLVVLVFDLVGARCLWQLQNHKGIVMGRAGSREAPEEVTPAFNGEHSLIKL